MALTTTTRPAAPGRRRFLALAMAAILLVAGAGVAQAQSLDDLRASGAVGEGADGFAIARANDAAVKSKVDQVNSRRRSIYAKRAAEQGISAVQVGKVYAGEILNRAPKGTWFRLENGTWTQK